MIPVQVYNIISPAIHSLYPSGSSVMAKLTQKMAQVPSAFTSVMINVIVVAAMLQKREIYFYKASL